MTKGIRSKKTKGRRMIDAMLGGGPGQAGVVGAFTCPKCMGKHDPGVICPEMSFKSFYEDEISKATKKSGGDGDGTSPKKPKNSIIQRIRNTFKGASKRIGDVIKQKRQSTAKPSRVTTQRGMIEQKRTDLAEPPKPDRRLISAAAKQAKPAAPTKPEEPKQMDMQFGTPGNTANVASIGQRTGGGFKKVERKATDAEKQNFLKQNPSGKVDPKSPNAPRPHTFGYAMANPPAASRQAPNRPAQPQPQAKPSVTPPAKWGNTDRVLGELAKEKEAARPKWPQTEHVLGELDTQSKERAQLNKLAGRLGVRTKESTAQGGAPKWAQTERALKDIDKEQTAAEAKKQEDFSKLFDAAGQAPAKQVTSSQPDSTYSSPLPLKTQLSNQQKIDAAKQRHAERNRGVQPQTNAQTASIPSKWAQTERVLRELNNGAQNAPVSPVAAQQTAPQAPAVQAPQTPVQGTTGTPTQAPTGQPPAGTTQPPVTGDNTAAGSPPNDQANQPTAGSKAAFAGKMQSAGSTGMPKVPANDENSMFYRYGQPTFLAPQSMREAGQGIGSALFTPGNAAFRAANLGVTAAQALPWLVPQTLRTAAQPLTRMASPNQDRGDQQRYMQAMNRANERAENPQPWYQDIGGGAQRVDQGISEPVYGAMDRTKQAVSGTANRANTALGQGAERAWRGGKKEFWNQVSGLNPRLWMRR